MKKKEKKRKIRFKGLIILLLFIYLLGTFVYYIYKLPIKNIKVSGNYYLKDNYIINYLNIENRSILNVNKNNIKKKLLKLDLISDVSIKKNYLGTLYINIIEDKILFYNWNNKKIVLSSGKEIDNNNYLGVPNLINFVPDDIYNELIRKMSILDRKVLSIVSEIEYSPSIVNEKVVDDKRFIFRMNDGNIVFVNTINIDKFNSYLELYESIVNKNGDIKGCLYLDSNSENKHFNKCDELKEDGSSEN